MTHEFQFSIYFLDQRLRARRTNIVILCDFSFNRLDLYKFINIMYSMSFSLVVIDLHVSSIITPTTILASIIH